jgi:hypothetical protein
LAHQRVPRLLSTVLADTLPSVVLAVTAPGVISVGSAEDSGGLTTEIIVTSNPVQRASRERWKPARIMDISPG